MSELEELGQRERRADEVFGEAMRRSRGFRSTNGAFKKYLRELRIIRGRREAIQRGSVREEV